MLALSVRQPYAELILRGVKTVELRSRATTIIGERFWIYASKKSVVSSPWSVAKGIWSTDLREPDATLPPWMLELAAQVRLIEPGTLLPTGVIVGSAVIERCEKLGDESGVAGGNAACGGVSDALNREGRRGVTPHSPLAAAHSRSMYAWHLADVERAGRFRKPERQPQPVWFRPF